MLNTPKTFKVFNFTFTHKRFRKTEKEFPMRTQIFVFVSFLSLFGFFRSRRSRSRIAGGYRSAFQCLCKPKVFQGLQTNNKEYGKKYQPTVTCGFNLALKDQIPRITPHDSCSDLRESRFSRFFFEISLLDLEWFLFHFHFSISIFSHFYFISIYSLLR